MGNSRVDNSRGQTRCERRGRLLGIKPNLRAEKDGIEEDRAEKDEAEEDGD